MKNSNGLLIAAAIAVVGMTGCTTKNYVKSQTAPVIEHTNQLDQKTADNNRALHEVDDRATAGLMDRFYEAQAAGLSPAAALRKAKLELMASTPIYRKPRYWAAFETFTRTLYR